MKAPHEDSPSETLKVYVRIKPLLTSGQELAANSTVRIENVGSFDSVSFNYCTEQSAGGIERRRRNQRSVRSCV